MCWPERQRGPSTRGTVVGMPRSANGWPVLSHSATRTWTLPGVGTRLRLEPGAGGFVLAHWALWYAESIEPLSGRLLDDWGWAYRPIRGRTSGFSNHASGTAVDLNATAHALGRRHTLSTGQIVRIRTRLRDRYDSEIFWGGDFARRADEMHYELACDRAAARALADRLLGTVRGRRIGSANPGATSE